MTRYHMMLAPLRVRPPFDPRVVSHGRVWFDEVVIMLTILLAELRMWDASVESLLWPRSLRFSGSLGEGEVEAGVNRSHTFEAGDESVKTASTVYM